jgi:hypothetical protein
MIEIGEFLSKVGRGGVGGAEVLGVFNLTFDFNNSKIT